MEETNSMYLIFTHFTKLVSETLNYLVNIPEKGGFVIKQWPR